MTLKVKDVMEHIEKWCPKRLAEDWDNVGLMVGNEENEVKKVLVALDATDSVVEEAVNNKVDMIITHHPLIFKALKNVTNDSNVGRTVRRLIQNNISLYSAHTNLDAADGGINDILVELFGINNTVPFDVTGTYKYKKLVVYVPDTHLDIVRDAISKAGAGWIGNYSHCTFSTLGEGSFLPLEGTSPHVGKQGKLEKVREFRLETIFPENMQKNIIEAMLGVHPYEEVAYDIYPLDKEGIKYGIGRVGEFQREYSVKEAAEMVKEKLHADHVRVVGNLEERVKKIAVCSGSGAGLWNLAKNCGANLLITGDVKHHDALDATANGVNVIDASHFYTEVVMVPVMKKYIENMGNIKVIEASRQSSPFNII